MKHWETDIKNHTYYYFNKIIIINDIDPDNIWLNQRSYKNILIHDIAYKTSYGKRPVGINFAKVDVYIKRCYWTWYIVSFHSDEKHNRILIELGIFLC